MRELIEKMFLSGEREIFEMFASAEQFKDAEIHTDWDNFFLMIPKYPKTKALLMAHVDRVIVPEKIRISGRLDDPKGKCVITGTPGLGADDRAGVLALWLLHGLEAPILLTNYEESGGHGAMAFTEYLEEHPEVKERLDVNVIVAFDRRGAWNFVRYSQQDNDIPRIMGYYKFKKEIGTWSDCLTVAEYLRVAEVNISVGYYFQHTPQERFHWHEFKKMFWEWLALVPYLAREKREISVEHFTTQYIKCPYCGGDFRMDEIGELLPVRGRQIGECPWCFRMLDLTEEVDLCDYWLNSYYG